MVHASGRDTNFVPTLSRVVALGRNSRCPPRETKPGSDADMRAQRPSFPTSHLSVATARGATPGTRRQRRQTSSSGRSVPWRRRSACPSHSSIGASSSVRAYSAHDNRRQRRVPMSIGCQPRYRRLSMIAVEDRGAADARRATAAKERTMRQRERRRFVRLAGCVFFVPMTVYKGDGPRRWLRIIGSTAAVRNALRRVSGGPADGCQCTTVTTTASAWFR